MIVGASNPAGVSTTSLNYVGDRAYAYSGSIDVPNSETILFEFDTGANNIDGELAIQNGSGSGDDMRYVLTFNDEIVAQIYAGTSDVFNQFQFPLDIVIPAFTKLKLTAVNITSGVGRAHTAIITGRVL